MNLLIPPKYPVLVYRTMIFLAVLHLLSSILPNIFGAGRYILHIALLVVYVVLLSELDWKAPGRWMLKLGSVVLVIGFLASFVFALSNANDKATNASYLMSAGVALILVYFVYRFYRAKPKTKRVVLFITTMSLALLAQPFLLEILRSKILFEMASLLADACLIFYLIHEQLLVQEVNASKPE